MTIVLIVLRCTKIVFLLKMTIGLAPDALKRTNQANRFENSAKKKLSMNPVPGSKK